VEGAVGAAVVGVAAGAGCGATQIEVTISGEGATASGCRRWAGASVASASSAQATSEARAGMEEVRAGVEPRARVVTVIMRGAPLPGGAAGASDGPTALRVRRPF